MYFTKRSIKSVFKHAPSKSPSSAPVSFIVCSFMITSERRHRREPLLHRHERVLGVDAVRVEHVRVAAHRREEHVLQYGRRQ